MLITITSARARRAVLAAATSLAVAALTACSFLPAQRDAETNEIVEAGSESAFDLNVGDCFNDQSDGEVSDVAALPCTEPHDNEIYLTFDLPDGDYPGEDSFTVDAEDGCVVGFEEFVGLPYEESELELYYLSPTQDSWETMSDREIACAIFDPAGATTGTLRDAGR